MKTALSDKWSHLITQLTTHQIGTNGLLYNDNRFIQVLQHRFEKNSMTCKTLHICTVLFVITEAI